MQEIPKEILDLHKRKLVDFPSAWIGYNANLHKYNVYIIPITWCNSLLITKIK